MSFDIDIMSQKRSGRALENASKRCSTLTAYAVINDLQFWIYEQRKNDKGEYDYIIDKQHECPKTGRIAF